MSKLSGLLTAYRVYCFAVAVAAFVLLALNFATATYSGLTTGRYEVVILTNVFHENYPEVVGLAIAVPGILKEAAESLIDIKNGKW